MTKRRGVVVALAVVVGIVAVVAGALLYRSLHRGPSDCDTVQAMLDYNSAFNDQTKASSGPDKPVLVSEEQYREWADRLKDYAGQISDETLSGNAMTAADLAGQLADLVPKYRAKPDDPAITRQYAGIGIEFGNAVNRLEYGCLNAG